MGVDCTPMAIAAATKAAEEHGLNKASFVQADITSLTGYDSRFNTVIDSTLFHSLPVEGRNGYLRSVHRAASPGASYYVLGVRHRAPSPAETEQGPNTVDEDDLCEAVSKYWEIDEIRPAFIHANVPVVPDAPFQMPDVPTDDKGRLKLPTDLLTAHEAG